MDDLAAFISARLDEDEAMANAAGGGQWAEHGSGVTSAALAEGDYGPRGYWVASASFACEGEAEGLHDGHAEHIARHDPARVLREVAARRRTMARHERKPDKQQPWCGWCTDDRHFEAWPCDDIRDLAATWSDHPDYRPEWAPGDG